MQQKYRKESKNVPNFEFCFLAKKYEYISITKEILKITNVHGLAIADTCTHQKPVGLES
jgi:uncharacterized pyridoxamine 5'-phosphate oxidase family protein